MWARSILFERKISGTIDTMTTIEDSIERLDPHDLDLSYFRLDNNKDVKDEIIRTLGLIPNTSVFYLASDIRHYHPMKKVGYGNNGYNNNVNNDTNDNNDDDGNKWEGPRTFARLAVGYGYNDNDFEFVEDEDKDDVIVLKVIEYHWIVCPVLDSLSDLKTGPESMTGSKSSTSHESMMNFESRSMSQSRERRRRPMIVLSLSDFQVEELSNGNDVVMMIVSRFKLNVNKGVISTSFSSYSTIQYLYKGISSRCDWKKYLNSSVRLNVTWKRPTETFPCSEHSIAFNCEYLSFLYFGKLFFPQILQELADEVISLGRLKFGLDTLIAKLYSSGALTRSLSLSLSKNIRADGFKVVLNLESELKNYSQSDEGKIVDYDIVFTILTFMGLNFEQAKRLYLSKPSSFIHLLDQDDDSLNSYGTEDLKFVDDVDNIDDITNNTNTNNDRSSNDKDKDKDKKRKTREIDLKLLKEIDDSIICCKSPTSPFELIVRFDDLQYESFEFKCQIMMNLWKYDLILDQATESEILISSLHHIITDYLAINYYKTKSFKFILDQTINAHFVYLENE